MPVLFLACKMQENEVSTSSSINLYKKYLKGNLVPDTGIFSGKIICIANEACRKCGESILENYRLQNCREVVLFDSTVYFGFLKNQSCSKVVRMSNDKPSRINFSGISGHRIYFVYNDSITRVKELNPTNSDSMYLFLDEI
jgi:hypothetical protein